MGESYNLTVLLLLIRSYMQNWLTMRANFYARVRKCQNMKHQKRENTGSIVLIIQMNIIIIIIIIMRIMFFRDKNYIYVQSPERRTTYYFGRWADEK